MKANLMFLNLSLLFVLSADAKVDLSVPELKKRFTVVGEIFVLSPDGSRVIDSTRSFEKSVGMGADGILERSWSSTIDGQTSIRLKQKWTMNERGVITARLEEFKTDTTPKSSLEPTFQDSLGVIEQKITDFSPIVYRLRNAPESKRIVVRLSPSIDLEDLEMEKAQLEGFPVASKSIMIYDSSGRIWAESVEADSAYYGYKTHLGTVALSYSPFDGAKPIGVVSGNLITLDPKDGKRVFLRSSTPLLPVGVSGVVFARFWTDKKSAALNSVHAFGSSDKARFNARLAKL